MWSRALDVRLSEWCCSVSMVWAQCFVGWFEQNNKQTRSIYTVNILITKLIQN